jgi:regulator of protease activity HflC (stomatin/prohibitin superfamily)
MSIKIQPTRWDYTKKDKFGVPIDVTLYYPLNDQQRKFLQEILTDFPDEEFFDILDEKTIRTILRTNDYSEIHQEKLRDLRNLYIKNCYE